MNCNDEVVTKLVGKLSLEFSLFNDYQEQLKLKKAIELILYDYDVVTKEKSIIASDLEEKLKLFLATKKIEGIAEKTLKNYATDIIKFSNFIRKPAIAITANDIRMYLALQCSNMKDTTICTKIYNLKTFFQWLQDEEYIPRNIVNKVKAPKVPKRLREGLTHEELELLRLGCNTDREKALLEFLAATGCRVSEVASLKISDLNFNDLSFRVIGKGNKERIGYFTPKAKILIEKYISNRKGENNGLFCSSRYPYGPIGKRAMEKEVTLIKERAGFDKRVFPHLIRHTYCTHKANSGMNMTVLQTLMGHTSLATTERYFKISNDLLKSEYKKYS